MNPDEIRQLISRAGSKAANFKRVDLQVHSDESGDFPRIQEYGDVRFEPGTENAKPVPSETILKAAVNKGLDVIAITDHMRSRKSCEVALASGKSGNNVVALPAIEVALRLTQVSRSSTDSVHLLCIFKEGKSSEDIERIFHGARGLKSYERRADGDVIDMDLKAFVENVHKNEGICIASHVNAEKGLRRAFFSLSEMDYVICKRDRESLEKQKEQPHWNDEIVAELKRLEDIEKRLANEIQNSYLEFLVDAGIDAIQIQKSAERQFYRGVHCETLRIRPLAAVLTSDAHCLEAIGFETKITYLKMTRSCWDDLRLALKDPETRVRYSDTVGTHRYTKIKGIVFVTTDGFFKGLEKDGKTSPQVLGFADNLTCLIGGRGAGKSAAIDALRYVFKEKGEVDSLPPNLRSDIYGRLGHTLKDTSIYLLLEE